jgi:hypothetical protein
MSTYQRVVDVLADGEWHSMEELKEVCLFPERWVEELRKDGLDVREDSDAGKIVLVAASSSQSGQVAAGSVGSDTCSVRVMAIDPPSSVRAMPC